MKGFRELDAQLKAEGWFDPSLWHLAYRIFEIFAMVFVGVGMMYLVDNPERKYTPWSLDTIIFYSGYVLFGIARGRCGWFMHEGGHGSLSGNMTVDRRIQEVFYCWGCGLSASYWRNQHNKHHAAPQKLEHDTDLNTMPLI